MHYSGFILCAIQVLSFLTCNANQSEGMSAGSCLTLKHYIFV